MRLSNPFILIAIIFQINPSTAFLSGLLNSLFGGWPYGVQPYGVQPSIYAIPPANNQNQQQPGQPPAYPTTNIAGAFNGLPMYNAGIGGALALPFVGIASVINCWVDTDNLLFYKHWSFNAKHNS